MATAAFYTELRDSCLLSLSLSLFLSPSVCVCVCVCLSPPQKFVAEKAVEEMSKFLEKKFDKNLSQNTQANTPTVSHISHSFCNFPEI